MSEPIRLCLALHNHQPVGNFHDVFQQAYEDSYLPFLEVFEPFESLNISLHTSGPLIEWLDEHHPDYLDRVANLVRAGRIEIVGGAFYESILTMIPSRDRIGQIRTYTQWLQERLGASIRGMWMPERVWEQSLTADLVRAGIDYTILDDFHFKNAGVAPDELHRYYITEDEGSVLRIFPGSEQLRYLLPFQEPQQTIDYLGSVHEHHPGSVLVFGDDGEKFGTWPDTKQHVYDNGWLQRFFEALTQNQDWIRTTTLSEAVDSTEPAGRIYLPEGSYREMTEWALPTPKQLEYEHLSHEMEGDQRWERIKQFVRGGYWRNFKVKYDETNEMYARMMSVSSRLHQLRLDGQRGELLDAAQRELYRGQCNCAYWHGAFGGVYLPHLRNAIFNHLIAADNLLDQVVAKGDDWLEAESRDYDLDGRPEVSLANDKIIGLIAPRNGGHLYELDIRSICHNLLATLTRREEAYHEKVRQGAKDGDGGVANIHDDRVVFKQADLQNRLHVDRTRRKSLVDHFYTSDASLEHVANGDFEELGDFATGNYDAKIRRGEDAVQVQLTRVGRVGEHAIKITKGITLHRGSSTLEIAYLLEDLPQDTLHFGVELNFAGMPSNADDRYFHRGGDESLGHLGSRMELADIDDLALVDQWLGLDVQLKVNRPTHFWTFPIETVSNSEGGYEAVHQSVVVQPHWFVQPNEKGKWSVAFSINADTSLAESRMQAHAEPAYS